MSGGHVAYDALSPEVKARVEEVDSPAHLRALDEAELPALCARLRHDIIGICGRVGGHLGASLGAVELIVAMHRVFETPQDALVFDVGHQAYAHKLLTGRRERIATLRQAGGVAPFLDPEESEHDALAAGHACTAVSAALGMLEGKRRSGKSGHVVAIVGDGALTGGLTYEGLNNAATWPSPLIVVLNDNQMSISANVGAVSRLLPGSGARTLFESLGFTYEGPLDGHDLPSLIAAFERARSSPTPVLLHAVTRKGRGFEPAESDARTRGHAMGPYELRAGKLVRSRGGQTTFSEAFAETLAEVMARDPRVVAVTPAMLEGSALGALHARYPDRVYDVGIAEQHAVTFAAGLAKEGLRPVCLIYSTFLQRAYDQVIHDVCLPRLPVVFAIDRAGLVGADGATHQGTFDLSFLRPLPGLTLMAPVGGEDLAPLLETALSLAGPSALRFPRGTLPELQAEWTGERAPLEGARWLLRPENPSAVIVALGPLAIAAVEAARARGNIAVLDPRFVTPLDAEAFELAARSGRILVVEEGTRHGGLGSGVLELAAEAGWQVRIRQLALPDAFIRHGDARVQRAELGLDSQGIGRAVDALIAE